MDPRELLRRLMADRGLNPNSLARAVHQRVKQPTIHRFLSGEASEPRRSTLEPVAKYFNVEVDAFFDPKKADEVFAARYGAPAPLSAKEPASSYQGPPVTAALALDERLQQLLLDLDDLRPARRSTIIDMIHQEAEEARAAAEHLVKKRAAAGSAAAKMHKPRPARLRVRVGRGDGNPSQGELRLSTVEDPFTAEPENRELAFYERISRQRLP